MSEVDDTITLARLLGKIYSEVFQRRSKDDSSILSKAAHNDDEQVLKEDIFSVLYSGTTIWVWGVSGSSNQTNSSPLQGVWNDSFWS